MTAVMVFDEKAKATQWRDALKAKVLQVKDAGVFPAWIGANIGIQEYFVGGLATSDDAISWPPETPPDEPSE